MPTEKKPELATKSKRTTRAASADKSPPPAPRRSTRASSSEKSPPSSRRMSTAALTKIPEEAVKRPSTPSKTLAKDDVPAVGTPKRRGRTSMNPTPAAVASPVRVTRRSVAALADEAPAVSSPRRKSRASINPSATASPARLTRASIAVTETGEEPETVPVRTAPRSKRTSTLVKGKSESSKEIETPEEATSLITEEENITEISSDQKELATDSSKQTNLSDSPRTPKTTISTRRSPKTPSESGSTDEKTPETKVSTRSNKNTPSGSGSTDDKTPETKIPTPSGRNTPSRAENIPSEFRTPTRSQRGSRPSTPEDSISRCSPRSRNTPVKPSPDRHANCSSRESSPVYASRDLRRSSFPSPVGYSPRSSPSRRSRLSTGESKEVITVRNRPTSPLVSGNSVSPQTSKNNHSPKSSPLSKVTNVKGSVPEKHCLEEQNDSIMMPNKRIKRDMSDGTTAQSYNVELEADDPSKVGDISGTAPTPIHKEKNEELTLKVHDSLGEDEHEGDEGTSIRIAGISKLSDNNSSVKDKDEEKVDEVRDHPEHAVVADDAGKCVLEASTKTCDERVTEVVDQEKELINKSSCSLPTETLSVNEEKPISKPKEIIANHNKNNVSLGSDKEPHAIELKEESRASVPENEPPALHIPVVDEVNVSSDRLEEVKENADQTEQNTNGRNEVPLDSDKEHQVLELKEQNSEPQDNSTAIPSPDGENPSERLGEREKDLKAREQNVNARNEDSLAICKEPEVPKLNEENGESLPQDDSTTVNIPLVEVISTRSDQGKEEVDEGKEDKQEQNMDKRNKLSPICHKKLEVSELNGEQCGSLPESEPNSVDISFADGVNTEHNMNKMSLTGDEEPHVSELKEGDIRTVTQDGSTTIDVPIADAEKPRSDRMGEGKEDVESPKRNVDEKIEVSPIRDEEPQVPELKEENSVSQDDSVAIDIPNDDVNQSDRVEEKMKKVETREQNMNDINEISPASDKEPHVPELKEEDRGCLSEDASITIEIPLADGFNSRSDKEQEGVETLGQSVLEKNEVYPSIVAEPHVPELKEENSGSVSQDESSTIDVHCVDDANPRSDRMEEQEEPLEVSCNKLEFEEVSIAQALINTASIADEKLPVVSSIDTEAPLDKLAVENIVDEGYSETSDAEYPSSVGDFSQKDVKVPSIAEGLGIKKTEEDNPITDPVNQDFTEKLSSFDTLERIVEENEEACEIGLVVGNNTNTPDDKQIPVEVEQASDKLIPSGETNTQASGVSDECENNDQQDQSGFVSPLRLILSPEPVDNSEEECSLSKDAVESASEASVENREVIAGKIETSTVLAKLGLKKFIEPEIVSKEEKTKEVLNEQHESGPEICEKDAVFIGNTEKDTEGNVPIENEEKICEEEKLESAHQEECCPEKEKTCIISVSDDEESCNVDEKVVDSTFLDEDEEDSDNDENIYEVSDESDDSNAELLDESCFIVSDTGNSAELQSTKVPTPTKSIENSKLNKPSFQVSDMCHTDETTHKKNLEFASAAASKFATDRIKGVTSEALKSNSKSSAFVSTAASEFLVIEATDEEKAQRKTSEVVKPSSVKRPAEAAEALNLPKKLKKDLNKEQEKVNVTEKSGFRVKLCNVPPRISLGELKESLLDFGICSGLLNLEVCPTSEKHKKTVIATYATKKHLEKALSRYGKVTVQGRRLFFLLDDETDPISDSKSRATPPKMSPKKKFVGVISDLPKEVTIGDIISAYEQEGIKCINKVKMYKLKSCKENLNFAKLEFSKKTALLKACIVTENITIRGNRINLKIKEKPTS